VINKRGGGPSQFLFEIFGEDLSPVKNYIDRFVKEVESVEPLHKEARDRLSFSKIAYFLQCPIRFKYIVVYGMKILYETPVDFGANVHRALQEIHERSKLGNIPNDNEIESIVNKVWFSPLYAEPNIDKAAKVAAIIQLQRYVKNYKESILQSDCTEVNFSFDLNQYVLTGKIDLLRKIENNYEVVDFKTSKSEPIVLGQVELQLDLYCLGVEENLKIPIIRQSAYFLGDDKVYSWDWSTEKSVIAKSSYKEIIDKIKKRDFSPRNEYCPYCKEFSAICPYARNSK
jgi:hypothetical protein